MSEHLLARFRQHTLDAVAMKNIAKALNESIVVTIVNGRRISYTEGDMRHCRGVPVFPRPSLRASIDGTIPGTNPLDALLDKERRQTED